MFRRGFKTWAEGAAAEIRSALGLANDAPLDPSRAAGYLNVPVLSPGDLKDLPDECGFRLTQDHCDEWSAITVTDGRNALIVMNSAHPATRRNSSLAHELAHVILGHEPSLMFMAPGTGAALRTHNKEQEDEAAWFSGVLLLPRAALLTVRRHRLKDDQACKLYGVSPAMLRYRINATGVDLQLSRGRNATTKKQSS